MPQFGFKLAFVAQHPLEEVAQTIVKSGQIPGISRVLITSALSVRLPEFPDPTRVCVVEGRTQGTEATADNPALTATDNLVALMVLLHAGMRVKGLTLIFYKHGNTDDVEGTFRDRIAELA